MISKIDKQVLLVICNAAGPMARPIMSLHRPTECSALRHIGQSLERHQKGFPKTSSLLLTIDELNASESRTSTSPGHQYHACLV